MQFVEVVPYHSSKFSTIDKNQELWLHSRIEVKLDLRSRVAIHSDVLELLILRCCVIIILLDQGNDWVPLGSEVQQGVHWSFLVQMSYQFFQTFWYLHMLMTLWRWFTM